MSVREERIATTHPRVNVIDRVLRMLSSVKLGITLMIVLIFFSLLGTIIVQHNLDAFDKYYGSLTPAEKQLYHTVGFFDLYHTWWFNTLLILFSLNLILVSIDIWPKAWRFLVEPKSKAAPGFLANQPWHQVYRVAGAEQLSERLATLFKSAGMRVTTMTEGGLTTIFGQRGVWNRFVVFAIHIAVLLILGAGFVGARWGFEGMIAMSPGLASNELFIRGNETLRIPDSRRVMPFQMFCEKIRVDLKDPKGALTGQNTVNWFTYVKIQDQGGPAKTAEIKVNSPLDHAGYRFFQSGPGRPGDASDITVLVKAPEGAPQEFKLERGSPVKIGGVGEVRFIRFLSDMRIVEGKPQSVSEEYNNPAAELEILGEAGVPTKAWAFNEQLSEFLEKQSSLPASALSVNGRRFVLQDYSKVGQEHVLQVQYDPGVNTIYFAFVLLCGSLISAFSFSHDRVWGVIDRRGDDVLLHMGAHTSHHRPAMEKRFAEITSQVSGWTVPLPAEEMAKLPRAAPDVEEENDATASD